MRLVSTVALTSGSRIRYGINAATAAPSPSQARQRLARFWAYFILDHAHLVGFQLLTVGCQGVVVSEELIRQQ